MHGAEVRFIFVPLIARRDSLKMNSTEKEGVKENLTNTTDAGQH